MWRSVKIGDDAEEEAFATFFTDAFFAGALAAAALLVAFVGALAAFDDAFAAALGAAAFLAGAFLETLVAVLAIRNSFVDGECIRQQILNNAFSQELKMAKLGFRTIVRVTCRFLVDKGPNAGSAPLNCALYPNSEQDAEQLEFEQTSLTTPLFASCLKIA
jgi:hypothetical protein